MTKKALKEMNLPEEQKSQLEADIIERDTYHSIKALADTPGGKALVDVLVSEILGIVHQLANSDADPLCAHLQAKMNLLRVIIKAEENEKAIDALLSGSLRE